MKLELSQILNSTGMISLNDLFTLFNRSDDIFLLKYDGARNENKNTIVLIGNDNRFETIRYEGDDLNSGLQLVLTQYLKYLP